jgi:hypothetical protein
MSQEPEQPQPQGQAQPETAPTNSLGSFDCGLCRQTHEDLPASFAFAFPDFVNRMMPWDREQRCQMTEDWCVVDGKYYYIRGCLELPIIGSDGLFVFGIWATLNRDDFERTMEFWEHPQRTDEEPYVSSLANSIPLYAETRGLKVLVHTRPVGRRPFIEVDMPEHELAAEQKQGISRQRIIQLAQIVLHGAPEMNCPP